MKTKKANKPEQNEKVIATITVPEQPITSLNQSDVIIAHRSIFKTMVRGCYDVQKLRIQIGNRIVSNFKVKMGWAPGTQEDTSKLDADAKKIIDDIRAVHEKMTITQGAISHLKPLNPDGTSVFEKNSVISNLTEYYLMNSYLELEKQEEAQFNNIEQVLRGYPIYTQYLKTVKGIGKAMAGVIVSEFDIHKAEYPSSLWMYAGLDVAPDGRGRSSRKEHLVKRTYLDKDNKEQEKDSLTHNRFLKTKLMGVLATSFLRAGAPRLIDKTKGADKNGPRTAPSKWYKIYADYKNRLETMPQHAEKTDGHRHNMSLRYMVKMFLLDLHQNWRRIEGLSVSVSYWEAKSGKAHGKAA